MPPGRTSGRHHSAATGGGASALASATPAQSRSCSSARPQTTRAFAGAQRSRKSHLRRRGLEQDELAIGKRAGERDSRSAVARSDIDDRALVRRAELARAQRVVEEPAPGGVEIERGQPRRLDDRLQPGVKQARRRRGGGARLPRSRSSRPRGARARCGRAFARRRSSARARPGVPVRRACSALRSGELLEPLAAALAVAAGVDDDLRACPRRRAEHRAREQLERVERLAVAADQPAELVALSRCPSATPATPRSRCGSELRARAVTRSSERGGRRPRLVALASAARGARRCGSVPRRGGATRAGS